MAGDSELLEKMESILDESKWNNLSMDLETGQGIEFANFVPEQILYNVVKIDDEEYLKELEEQLKFEIVSKDINYITFGRNNNEDVEKYLNEIQRILEILDSDQDNISNIEMKNIN